MYNTEKMRIRFFVLHVILPIALGGIIYTCWRKPSLLMFSWYHTIGLETFISLSRQYAAPFYGLLPQWVIFSLPNGLWVYAMTAFMAYVWHNSESAFLRTVWLSIGLLLGVGSEILQAAGVISGTFDLTDVFLCLVASAAAMTMAKVSNLISN
jgi:hypothetical protein